MKLNCNVEVNNRIHNLTNLSIRKKSQRGYLVIGRQSMKNDELYILLQTEQNKCGIKYKVNDNIERIFVKFIENGKATIRIKEPPHDLIIQSDAIPLKSFIHVLKLASSKKVHLSTLAISNLNGKKISNTQKTKITIKKNSEYPTLQGFPRFTEELYIIGLDRKSFDLQILKLNRLKVLDLSNNQITSLPKDLGSLPHLQQLILSQNQLGKAAISKWTWLDQNNIRNTLCLLDLSSNFLTEIPEKIGKLDALVNLKLSCNSLIYLPQSMGNLTSLKYLDLSQNSLQFLSGSMRKLRLLEIDISGNSFSTTKPYYECMMQLPSLVECAARIFLKTRISYNASLIPNTLVKYLDSAKYCVCGTACFQYFLRKPLYFNLNSTICSVKFSNDSTVPYDCFFCTLHCFRFYSKVMS
ncbi:leucine-rich repeat protein 1 [Vespula squamosa]|uniref:Leucine-rich repeat protein 1 n=1 Tax=Vespula squamosa TaxID=30214 RepID=A0ABD2B7F5_VESSQ